SSSRSALFNCSITFAEPFILVLLRLSNPGAVNRIAKSSISPAQSRKQPEQQCQSHAQYNARDNREIKRGVLAFMHDVAGQASQAKRQSASKKEQRAHN